MADAYTRALGRGCMHGLLWQVVGIVVSLIFVLLMAVLFAGSALLPVEPWVQTAIAGALLSLFLFGFVAAAFAFALRRARLLDPAFAAVGMQGRSFGINGRAYRGSVRGRRAFATYHRGSRGSAGPMLEVSVDTAVMTKLGLGTRTSAGTLLAGALGLRELPLPDPAYARFVASADDPGFASSLLLDRAVMPIVLRLVDDATETEMRMIALRPGAVRLSRRFFAPASVTSAELSRTLDDLTTLAELAERRPPPAVQSEPSAFERNFRENPGRSGCLIAAGLVGMVVVIALAAGALVFALSFDSSGPPPPGKAHPRRR